MNKIFSFILLSVLFSRAGQADEEVSKQKILCQTPYQEQSFIITSQKIILLEKEYSPSPLREMASVPTQNTAPRTLSQVISRHGHQFKIFLKSTQVFNEAEDYLTLTSPRGYRMTYALKCRFI